MGTRKAGTPAACRCARERVGHRHQAHQALEVAVVSAFSDATQDFFAALAGLLDGDFGTRVNAVLQALPDATSDELVWAAGPLTEVVARSPEPRISALGILGELVCRG